MCQPLRLDFGLAEAWLFVQKRRVFCSDGICLSRGINVDAALKPHACHLSLYVVSYNIFIMQHYTIPVFKRCEAVGLNIMMKSLTVDVMGYMAFAIEDEEYPPRYERSHRQSQGTCS